MTLQKPTITTWVDELAASIGIDSLIERTDYDIPPSVAAVSLILFIDTVPAQLAKEATGRTATILRNPLWLVIPLAILGALLVTRDLQRRLQMAVQEMHFDKRPTDVDLTEQMISDRLRWSLFLASAALVIINNLVFVTVPVILATDGIPGMIGNFVFTPFVYTPVIIDFVVTFLGIQIVIPRRMKNSNIELDFLDPEGLGGLRPIGELIKHSYYYVMLGIIAFALFVYGPTLFPDTLSAPVTPSPLIDSLFTFAWIAGVAAVGYSLYVFHRFMHQQKRDKLFELDRQYRDLVDHPWEISRHRIPEDTKGEVDRIKSRMDQVTSTKEYPATFAMWTQLIIGLILPKSVQLLLSGI